MKVFEVMLIFVFAIRSTISEGIQCRDEEGNPVDWFYMYKLPKLKTHKNDLVRQGLGYMFLTSKQSDKWYMSNKSIGDTISMLGRTMAPIYSGTNNESFWMIYNDQTKWYVSFTKGHTKGVLGGDKNGGFWLVHSIPKLTSYESYSYPSTGKRNGQNALCLSLSAEELNKIGIPLKYNTPVLRYFRFPKALEASYPNLIDVKKGVKGPPWNYLTHTVTKGGTTFIIFAKSKKFDKDLYEWVAEGLKTDMEVQSWPWSMNNLPPSCQLKYRVTNVKGIKLPDNTDYPVTIDHSKWAVSSLSQEPWACVGDINRAKSQEKRGGGTVCLRNYKIWKAYHNLVNKTEDCTNI